MQEDHEVRKRSAEKWRKRFLRLLLILPILMIPGYITVLFQNPDPSRNYHDDLGFGVGVLALTLAVMLPCLWFLVWLLCRPSNYGNAKRYSAIVGAATGLSVVNGFFWFLLGGIVGLQAGDPSGAGQAFAAHLLIVGPFMAVIAIVIGSVSGLIYGSFRK